VKRLTTFEDYDVPLASMGDGKDRLPHRMDIWNLGPRFGEDEMLNVALPSDRLQVRERFAPTEAPSRFSGHRGRRDARAPASDSLGQRDVEHLVLPRSESKIQMSILCW